MAVEYVLYCDGCGERIASSRLSVRAARAHAQLNHGANKGPDGDRCASCRLERGKAQLDELAALKGAHSAGTRR